MSRRKKMGFSIILMLLASLLAGCRQTNMDIETKGTEQEQQYVETVVPSYVNEINGIEKFDDKIDYSDHDN